MVVFWHLITSTVGFGAGAALLPFVPKPVKLTLLLLFLINAPSFPLVWHIRTLFWPYRSYLLSHLKGKRRWLDDWAARNAEKGRISGLRTRLRRVAWLDDSDFNLHLSNSCYAKSADPARFEYAGEALGPVFHAGAHCALGATHYTFIREIPIGSEYVLESRAAGWGEKWFYIVTEYIIYPKNHSTNGSKSHHATTPVQQVKISLAATLPVPPAGITLSAAPSPSASGSTTPSSRGADTPGVSTLEAAKSVASVRARKPREDGGVVCCFSVVEYCFKVGRVTVPPRIAMYIAVQSPLPSAREHARSLVLSKDGGRAWLRSGWKDELNAHTLGRDIGLEDVPTEDGVRELEEVESWVERGRRGMERVGEGLGMI
ncbi:hypothetical protein JCM24511_08091 [Saitozyma sp. JCM 24511]|nr:hypothetical protein JCM24511_08091 [Saitozyma sp. JCM 24511]